MLTLGDIVKMWVDKIYLENNFETEFWFIPYPEREFCFILYPFPFTYVSSTLFFT